ncbi:MAG: hypothetical protein IMZ59_03775 [Actinobacteria bacterium]|nr:hypothetical protein [Actinomycetota bacterium]
MTYLVGNYLAIDVPKTMKLTNCHINIKPPKQLCFICNKLFEAYLIDDEKWEKLQENYRNKLICRDCYEKNKEVK